MRHVRLLGTPQIVDESGAVVELRGQKSWAVLARVLLADRPLTRRELSTELFPDAVDPLGSLRWCLAGLRKALGSSELLVGDPVSCELPPGASVDVLELADGRFDLHAVGELLEGVDLQSGPEFTTWLLVARQQVASRVAALLRDEAITAISRGSSARALAVAEVMARRWPYDEGGHILLVKTLVLAGHHDAAVRHVEVVERLFREELGGDPSPALRSAARASVAATPPGVSAGAVASTLLESGRAALSAGAVEAGLDCLRRAGAQAEAAGDDALLGRCLFELGTALVHALRGFDDEGCVLLEQSALLARAEGDQPTAVAALRERGYADALAGRRPEAQRHLVLAAEYAADDTALRAGVLGVTAFNLADWGRLEEGLECYRAAIEAARSAGDRRSKAWSLGLGGWAALAARDTALAVSWTRECLSTVREIGWTSFEPWPTAVLAEVRLTEGHDASTVDELERCFAMSCHLDDPCWEGGSGRVLAMHHAHAGEYETALRWIVDARQRCVRRTDTWVGLLGSLLLTEAQIRAAAGDPAGANATARELVALAARTHLDHLLPMGVALLV